MGRVEEQTLGCFVRVSSRLHILSCYGFVGAKSEELITETVRNVLGEICRTLLITTQKKIPVCNCF